MAFFSMRNAWALRAPQPTPERIHTQMELDRQANPHNEPYHNKKPRRSEAEIVSDLAFAYADTILLTQLGDAYKQWLRENTVERFGLVKLKPGFEHCGRSDITILEANVQLAKAEFQRLFIETGAWKKKIAEFHHLDPEARHAKEQELLQKEMLRLTNLIAVAGDLCDQARIEE